MNYQAQLGRIMPNLLSCPFCGAAPKDDFAVDPGAIVVHIWCPSCSAEVRGETPEQAIERWNRRVSPPVGR